MLCADEDLVLYRWLYVPVKAATSSLAAAARLFAAA